MNKIVLTGIKPTGTPHVGNYFGCIKPAIEFANSGSAQSYFFLADYHALTTVKSGVELKKLTHEIACAWLACGLDPKKTVFYRQSDVPEVFELSTILSNVTPKGLMNRAHAYKASVAANEEAGRDIDDGVNMGLYCYPMLMAADIILFGTDFVPVGQDQKQHIEIAQDIVKAFNANFGAVLKIPQAQINEAVATIPGLDGRKMSKSYGNVIPLLAGESELKKSIMRIVTDSSAPDAEKDKNAPIFKIYSLFDVVPKEFYKGVGWGEIKQRLFEKANAVLAPFRERYNYLMNNPAEVEKILQDGARCARAAARVTLDKVRAAILGNTPSASRPPL